MPNPLAPASLTLATLAAAACGPLYYSTMEKLGYQKRDLLVERVQEAREEQADAQTQFQSTFDTFKQLTGFDGGELESAYKKLNSSYERSKSAATAVTERVASIEKV